MMKFNDNMVNFKVTHNESHQNCLRTYFYRPQRSCGKVMFLHLSVSHSVHRGVCVPACTTGHMTRGISVGGGGSLSRGVSVQDLGVSVQDWEISVQGGGPLSRVGDLCPGWGRVSVQGGGGSLSRVGRGSLSRMGEDLCPGWGLCPEGERGLPRPCMVTSGRYASFWNAFLYEYFDCT